MHIWRIRRVPHGGIELFLVLPLFLLLAWGAGVTAIMLHQSERLERAGWYYAMAKSHEGNDMEQVRQRALDIFTEAGMTQEIQYESPGTSVLDAAARVSPLAVTDTNGAVLPLPAVFLLFLGYYPREREKLSIEYNLPGQIFNRWGTHEIANHPTSPRGGFDKLESSLRSQNAEVEIPGNNFKERDLLAHGLGLEATKDTSYPCLPIEFWGIKELMEAGNKSGLVLLAAGSQALDAMASAASELCPF
ncbi:MAG TPA: hypothetical protein VI895_15130 [Bdellovibrionota bacterium]|nr:hypothetical protein [Bdellovibrionota bacterium]